MWYVNKVVFKSVARKLADQLGNVNENFVTQGNVSGKYQ